MKVSYLSGLPRSGSTLLMNILAQNPKVKPSATSPLCGIVSAMAVAYTNSAEFKAMEAEEAKNGFYRMVYSVVNRYGGSFTDWSVRYIDKSRGWPKHYELLADTAISAGDSLKPLIVVTIRNPVDILASLELNIRKNPSYLASCGQAMDTVGKRVNHWLEDGVAPLGTALAIIKDAVERRVADNFFFVRYEDLITDTKKTLKQIEEYLLLNIGTSHPQSTLTFNYNLSNIEQVTEENDIFHMPYGDHKLTATTIKPSTTNAENVLPEYVISHVYEKLEGFYDLFYPEIGRKL